MIRSQVERNEVVHAQIALIVAIALELFLDKSLVVGPKLLIAGLELLLVFGIGLTEPHRETRISRARRDVSLALIALISLANATSMALVARDLISGSTVAGKTLLASAGAIFITNIIMFSLWYWELDSPGLSGRHGQNVPPHFDFPQHESMHESIRNWEPSFFDYLYVSITNGSAFSPTDTMPLTHIAKSLMSIQALISLITVVLVTARAVNILG